MIGWLLRLLLWRFARRSGPIGLLAMLGGPFPRLVLMFLALRYFGGRGATRVARGGV
jgi:hypothetical protein